MNCDKPVLDELVRQEIEGYVQRRTGVSRAAKAGPYIIIRRADGAQLTHLAGPVSQFHLLAGTALTFPSVGKAQLTIRCDLGEDLAGFDIVPARELQTATLAGCDASVGTPASRRASSEPTAPARSAAA